MVHSFPHIRCVVFSYLICLLFVAFSAGSEVRAVQVVVHASNDTENIRVEQIRRIFSMRQTVWSKGQAITVYVLPNEHQIHQLFSTQVLGMFPYQLNRIWNKLVYSGLGEEPIKVQSEQEMLERVSQTPGAIGYVMQSNNLDNVYVINVLKE